MNSESQDIGLCRCESRIDRHPSKGRWSSCLGLLLVLPLSIARPDSTQATQAIARPFLQLLFGEGNGSAAYERFATADFIQHNPKMGNGVKGRAAYFAARQHGTAEQYPSPAQWANVIDNVLVDGELFAVHHHVFTRPTDVGRVFVDIWRVADGRIAEHWDVIQTVPATLRNSNSMWCGKGSDYAAAKALDGTLAAPTCGLPDPNTSRVKSLGVVTAYTQELASGDVRGSIERWFAPKYVQHSPNIADGTQAAIGYLLQQFGTGAKPTGTTARILAQGDLVLFHRHALRAGEERGTVQADLFRVTNGKISEHWDVKQPVPPHSVNNNLMW